MFHGNIIVLLGFTGTVGGSVVNAEDRLVSLPVEANLDSLGDLPQLGNENE